MIKVIASPRNTEYSGEDKRKSCGLGIGRSGLKVTVVRKNHTMKLGIWPSNVWIAENKMKDFYD